MGSKPKKKLGRGTLRQGFPWSRLKEFRVMISFSCSFSFLCCPLVTYDKMAFAIRALTEEGCRQTCKKLNDFLSLKISLEEGVECREEEEGVPTKKRREERRQTPSCAMC